MFRRILRILCILFDLRILAAVINFALTDILQKSKFLKLRVYLNTAIIANSKPVTGFADFWVLLAENHWKDSLSVLCNRLSNYQFGINEGTNEERLKKELRQLIKR